MTLYSEYDEFFLKAIESKGYKMSDVVKLSDDEIDELNLSSKLMSYIKDIKNCDKIPTIDEIKQDVYYTKYETAESINGSFEAIIEYNNGEIPQVKNLQEAYELLERINGDEPKPEPVEKVVKDEHVEKAKPEPTKNVKTVKDEAKPKKSTAKKTKKTKTKVAKVEDEPLTIQTKIKMIEAVINTKNCITISPYLVVINKKVPADIVNEVGVEKINELISDRIKKVKRKKNNDK